MSMSHTDRIRAILRDALRAIYHRAADDAARRH